MATASTSSFTPPGRQPFIHAHAPVMAAPAAPSGTFAPGTKVQVGLHRVVIEKYLSQGGFAHVYLVRLPKAIDGDDGAVLKRVAVPDKEALANMRTEVETMKKLQGRRHIVTYMDSHASQLKGGGYEVFLLMEYCNGGGLIDLMNTRLQNRLTEPEILTIFSDVARGVADMHYLKPPLLHRDLKVENVLITSSGSARRYKLCDFGSAAHPTPAATNAAEGALIEDDIQRHTTLQYRSPEMIDVYRKQPIDEKSDIWALGVFLYKLCYYKTPFEDLGQMAILNARFKFPGYPLFSDDIKKLIASMLRENPQLRPNIYQVVREVCMMRGTDIPLKDIYVARTVSEARGNQQLSNPEPNVASPPLLGAYHVKPVEEKKVLPDIVPMRRGRPTRTEVEHNAVKPSPSPMRGASKDPFEALDSPSSSAPTQDFIDDVSIRFPPLDDFSILHDAGSKFAFDLNSETPIKAPKDIRDRVTDALADDAFARPSAPDIVPGKAVVPPLHLDAKPKEATDSSKSTPPVQRPEMVSTGTMTSPTAPPATIQNVAHSPQPIFHLPPQHRSSSQPRRSDPSPSAASSLKPDAVGTKRPGLRDHRSQSQILTHDVGQSTTSSRPSLEGQRPSMLHTNNTINRSKSASSRSRPTGGYDEPKKPVFPSREISREEPPRKEPSQEKYETEYVPPVFNGEPDSSIEASNISSNVDYLRAIEEKDPSRRREKRLSGGSKHIKRSSMPSISLSGTKSLLAGRFGDAFRRFETNAGSPGQRGLCPSPERGESDLTPIAGSEATDGRSDDGDGLEETEPISPEIRRELERRRLSQEEKRVTDAATAYRQKFTEKIDDGRAASGEGPVNSRAASIQSKVKTLLDENGRSSPKPDREFGRYVSQPPLPKPVVPSDSSSRPVSRQQPAPRKSLNNAAPQPPVKLTSVADNALPSHKPHPSSTSSAPPTVDRPFPRPSAPPKPHALRTGNNREESFPAKPVALAGKTLSQPVPDPVAPAAAREDWETNFSKRYPALSGLEMVETEIDGGGGGGRRGDV